jgi:hypothetical protein
MAVTWFIINSLHLTYVCRCECCGGSSWWQGAVFTTRQQATPLTPITPYCSIDEERCCYLVDTKDETLSSPKNAYCPHALHSLPGLLAMLEGKRGYFQLLNNSLPSPVLTRRLLLLQYFWNMRKRYQHIKHVQNVVTFSIDWNIVYIVLII